MAHLLNQDEEDIDCDERLNSKHRKKKNKVRLSSRNWLSIKFLFCVCYSQVSVCAMLSIPTVWFSFAAFIIATACNGFLSINLEPQVLPFKDLFLQTLPIRCFAISTSLLSTLAFSLGCGTALIVLQAPYGGGFVTGGPTMCDLDFGS